jgi:hypothetical protein
MDPKPLRKRELDQYAVLLLQRINSMPRPRRASQRFTRDGHTKAGSRLPNILSAKLIETYGKRLLTWTHNLIVFSVLIYSIHRCQHNIVVSVIDSEILAFMHCRLHFQVHKPSRQGELSPMVKMKITHAHAGIAASHPLSADVLTDLFCPSLRRPDI